MEEKIKIAEVSLACYYNDNGRSVIFSKTNSNITTESLYLKKVAGITLLVLGEKEYIVELIGENNGNNAYCLMENLKCYFKVPSYVLHQINGLLKNN